MGKIICNGITYSGGSSSSSGADLPVWSKFEAMNKTTAFGSDGSVTETSANGLYVKKTVFNSDGSVTEVLTDSENSMKYTKNTVFNSDGSITETLSSEKLD